MNTKSLLYLMAMVLVLFWGIGVFLCAAGQMVHVLLIIALVAMLLGLVTEANEEF